MCLMNEGRGLSFDNSIIPYLAPQYLGALHCQCGISGLSVERGDQNP